jgi:hypothetical protein
MYHDPKTHPRQPPFKRPERYYKKTTTKPIKYGPLNTSLYHLYDYYYRQMNNMLLCHGDEERINEYQVRLQDLRDEMNYYGIPIPKLQQNKYFPIHIKTPEEIEVIKERMRPSFDYKDTSTYPKQPPYKRLKRDFNWLGYDERYSSLRECLEKTYDKYFEKLYKPKVDYNEEAINELKLQIKDIADEMEYYGIPLPYTDKNSWLDYWKMKNIEHWGYLTSKDNDLLTYYQHRFEEKFPQYRYIKKDIKPEIEILEEYDEEEEVKKDVDDKVKERGKGFKRGKWGGGSGYGKSSWI